MDRRDFGFGAKTPLEHFLNAATAVPGFVGRSARRKLMRRIKPRAEIAALAAFDRCLSDIGKDDVVLDLGANVGDFTETLAATGATVHAYEPDPYAFHSLSARFEGKPNVCLYNAAVAAKSGSVQLSRLIDFDKDPAFRSTGSSIYFDRGSGEFVTVEAVSFADALARCGKPIALIKMDIEGAEFDILEHVFAAPTAYDFGSMFVETHERTDAGLNVVISRWRKQAETHPRYINLYWP
jgi:FkbM family methyltransferase